MRIPNDQDVINTSLEYFSISRIHVFFIRNLSGGFKAEVPYFFLKSLSLTKIFVRKKLYVRQREEKNRKKWRHSVQFHVWITNCVLFKIKTRVFYRKSSNKRPGRLFKIFDLDGWYKVFLIKKRISSLEYLSRTKISVPLDISVDALS